MSATPETKEARIANLNKVQATRKQEALYQFALTLLQMKLANTRRMTSDV